MRVLGRSELIASEFQKAITNAIASGIRNRILCKACGILDRILDDKTLPRDMLVRQLRL